MYRIARALLLSTILCVVSCADSAVIEFFQEPETGKVVFRAGEVNKTAGFNLSQLKAATIGILPVRSSLGGGLGEEVATKYFYDNLTNRFENIKFISNAAASDLFTEMDMWEDYFEYLDKYHQHAVAKGNFDELKGLYQKLGASYIININADYTLMNKYPNAFETNIQTQIWDMNSGKKVWEGFGRGQDIVYSADDVDAVKQKMVDWVCRRIAEELAGATTTTGLITSPNNL